MDPSFSSQPRRLKKDTLQYLIIVLACACGLAAQFNLEASLHQRNSVFSFQHNHHSAGPVCNAPAESASLEMSFTNAPVTRTLVYGLIGTSIAVSLLDIKHYFFILVDLHLWRFHQSWRALIYQLCYTNSSEALFAAMTLYNLRCIERLWGSRKYAVSVSPLNRRCPAKPIR